MAFSGTSLGDGPGLQDPQSGNSLSLANLNSADRLNKMFEAVRRGRQMYELQWKLNLAFYKGKQYAYYNKASKRIEQLPVDDADKPRYRVRLVSNQILVGCMSMLAKFTKTKPVMHCTPGTGSDRDLKAAQMCERLLEYWWQDFQLDHHLQEALLWSMIAGQGYWEIKWDPHANKAITFLLDPNGKPVVDQTLADMFRAQLNQQGVQPQERTMYLGDICVDVVSPFDIFLDPTVDVFEQAKYAFRVVYMDPDTIKARWNVQLQPDAVTASPDATLPTANMQVSLNRQVAKVYIGYFRPQATLPKGRYVVWAQGKILQDEPWPYPFEDLPFVKFSGIKVPGDMYDSSVIQQAMPIQKELNKTISQIVEYKNLTIKPQILAPYGSLRTRLTNEPGAVFEYTPIAGLAPTPIVPPQLPQYVFEHLADLNTRMADVFYMTDVSEGTVPPNVEAGVAIDLLQEMATDRIAPHIQMMEMTLARAGRLMLDMAKKYYIEPRLLKIRGFAGSTQVKEFTNADIQGGVDVVVETGSGLPRTRAGRQARVENLIQLGVIPVQSAWKYLDMADLTGMSDIMALDEDQALREQDKIMAGQPLNPVAAEQAQDQIEQTGVDPQSGQPIQSPQQAQQIIQQAGLQPSMFDNHQVHLDIHSRFMKSIEYESLPPEFQENLQTHMMAHFQVMLSLPAQVTPNAPKVSYNIRSVVAPDVATELLKRSGVNVTPEQVAAPPLDERVIDQVDKTNAEGGDASSHEPASMALELAQQQQQLQQQQQMHEQTLAHNQQKMAMQQLQQAQQMTHAHASHQADLQQKAFAAQMAQHKTTFERKRASQGPPKAAPKAPPRGR